jgi:hypothetical protein
VNLRSTARSQRSGQALPEFALVVPLLLVLLFGTIQVGLVFGGYNALINSVRETARYGSVCVGPSSCGPTVATYLTQKVAQGGFAYKGAPRGQVEYQAYQLGGKWHVRMRVTACINTTIFIPLVGVLIHSSDPSVYPLKSVETFRVEGQPAGSASTDPAVALETATPAWGTAFPAAGGTC